MGPTCASLCGPVPCCCAAEVLPIRTDDLSDAKSPKSVTEENTPAVCALCAALCFLALAEVLPIRADDLSDATLPLWVAAGYDELDTRRFLHVYRDMAASRNTNADLKIRLTTNVT